MGDQSIQRKPAAILYADVAGYSRLTGLELNLFADREAVIMFTARG